MQSSGMVAFRATIMIVCMIALPLAAVVGTALPKVVQTAIQGKSLPASPTDDAEPSTSASRSGDVAPSTTPVAETPSERLPRARITAIRPVASPTPNGVPPGTSGAATVGENESTASLWSRGAQPPATARRVPHGAERRPQRGPGGGSLRGMPRPPRHDESPLKATTYSAPIESDTDDSYGSQRAGHSAADSTEPPADDPLSRGERRLRRLGAIGYRLETWGLTGELYRFSCKVALSHERQATRHFEATDTSPAKVIEAVVKQVEAWDRP